MRLSSLRRAKQGPEPGVTGLVRLDKRTKNLVKRLKAGDIAVIDHVDLDRVSAEALVACDVSAVINVSESISGRYPNLGPEIIAAAGIPLVDHTGDELLAALDEGQIIRVDAGVIYRDGRQVGSGEVYDAERILELMTEARAGLSSQIESFTANAMEYLRRERDLLLDGIGVPDIETRIEGRHVVIVVRGYDYKQDLAALRHYIGEYRPLLWGVDRGADALVKAGYTPDVIVGDMDSVSDATLRSGAELVVHAHRDGRVPGLERLERLGLEGVAFPATGTSEDIAMLLADSKGAALIVIVGSHAALVEFLDKGRSGMASTFLTRLRVGPKLVDAKAVGQLHHSRIRTWQILLLIISGMLALMVALSSTPAGDAWLSALASRWSEVVDWLEGIVS